MWRIHRNRHLRLNICKCVYVEMNILLKGELMTNILRIVLDLEAK